MNFEQRPQAARYSPPLHFLGGLFMVLAVSGCMSTSKVVADDQHVFIPSLRAAVSLEDDKRPAAEPQTGRTIEFGFAKAKGGGDQFLAPGQSPITLNNTTFIAPQQMRNNFDFNYAEAAFRWRKFFRERSLGIEVAGGVGRAGRWGRWHGRDCRRRSCPAKAKQRAGGQAPASSLLTSFDEGGELGGKKTVEGDQDLPPVTTTDK